MRGARRVDWDVERASAALERPESRHGACRSGGNRFCAKGEPVLSFIVRGGGT
jgi:hypothetical protein